MQFYNGQKVKIFINAIIAAKDIIVAIIIKNYNKKIDIREVIYLPTILCNFFKLLIYILL